MTPMNHRCIAPDDNGHLCGKPATTERTIAGLVCHLCDEHAREVDSDDLDIADDEVSS